MKGLLRYSGVKILQPGRSLDRGRETKAEHGVGAIAGMVSIVRWRRSP